MSSHNGILPREGFCADVILRLIRRTALNPSLVLPLLLLSRYTKRGQDWSILHPTAARRLKILTYLALARRFSAWLADRSRNNWVNDRYIWPREIALVTGGAAGIGANVVRLLAQKGVTVVVLDVQPMTFTAGPKVHYYQCDLRSPESVNAVADRVRSEVGYPTIIVNNAGVARGKSILDSEPADVRFTFDVNTLAHYWVVKAFLPNIVKRNHGMVVTVSSAAAWLALPGMTDYCSSKAAALSFHEGLTGELKFRYKAPRVRTVSVHPGHSKTALFTGFNQGNPFFMPSLHPETMAEAIVKQILTGRSGNVILPETVSLLTLSRAMPDWYFMSNINGGKGAMNKWSGRQVIENVASAPAQGSESQTTEGGESTVLVSSQ